MNFFIDNEDEDISIKHHGLWVEKYRPNKIDEYICDNLLRETLEDFIDAKDIPHILLHGDQGAGKTTLAKLLAKEIPCDMMYVNASDNNGIDFVRTKIKPFAESSGFNPLKIVILDEADYTTLSAQASLRNLMEAYSQSTRFILTCNYVEKIIKPLHSRCQTFLIDPPNKKDVAVSLKKILDLEGIQYSMDDIKKIVNDFYPDIRKCINYTQQASTSGKIKHTRNQSASYELQSKLIELLQSKKSSAFNDIRQLVNDSGVKNFEMLYTCLYDNIDEYAKKSAESIITLAEYSYQNSLVIDKEITFMACIAQLLKSIK